MVYNGKLYEQMDDLGGFPTIFGNTHIYIYIYKTQIGSAPQGAIFFVKDLGITFFPTEDPTGILGVFRFFFLENAHMFRE